MRLDREHRESAGFSTPLGRCGLSSVLFSALVLFVVGCQSQRESASITAAYDGATGRLSRLISDSNNNGFPETWSYMDGGRVLRIEVDGNEDGVIDRWEYYGPDRQLEKVGLSRANDGVIDSWLYEGPNGTIARIEMSTARNGIVDRTEYFENGSMVRAEEDADGNGAVDKWETFADGVLTSVAFDVEGLGYPTRRLVYGQDGTLDRIESEAEARRALETASAQQ